MLDGILDGFVDASISSSKSNGTTNFQERELTPWDSGASTGDELGMSLEETSQTVSCNG